MAITRLTGGLTPADGSDPRTFPAIFNGAADLVEANESALVAAGTAIAGLDGRLTTAEGDITTLQQGFRYVGTIYYTSSGTFAKADPLGTGDIGLRAIRVRVVGGGGSGGGIPSGTTAANPISCGGGGAGGYAEAFLLASALSSSETVTRGSGGASTNSSNNGGVSSFGAFASATGGVGGQTRAAVSGPQSTNGRAGGIGTVGDLLAAGGAGTNGASNDNWVASGQGGTSIFGGGAETVAARAGGSVGLAGNPGTGFGGGGTGAVRHREDAEFLSGAGSDGIVIVDCFV
jgi:hypothetical protein